MDIGRNKHVGLAALVLVGVIVVTAASIYLLSVGRVQAQTSIGTVPVGRLSERVLKEKLTSRVEALNQEGFAVQIDGERYRLYPEQLGITFDTDSAVAKAWSLGRRGNVASRMSDWARPLFGETIVPFPISLDERVFALELDTFIVGKEEPGRDVRLAFQGATVSVLTDTKPGLVVPREALEKALYRAAVTLSAEPISLARVATTPAVSVQNASDAKASAEQVVAKPLVLRFEARVFTLTPERLAGFLESIVVDDRLEVSINERALSEYVTEVAAALNTAATNPELVVRDGKVISFTAPRPGRALEETNTITLVRDELLARRSGKVSTNEITLPVVVRDPGVHGSAAELGIAELIGRAGTTFAGSPKNRRENIKNGTRFLTGILIEPGQVFSTVGALGTIDNTTGYLPELVIKGNRTVPEFGGGLCQVSTTLFRAVLNAGLPVVARQNHSYRVSYYERDANGVYIGPGLDATIYQPNPDFKFMNDTGKNILISGYVDGDVLTFELYGTKDGRVAKVDGPRTLSTTPSGPPIYVETDKIPVGEKRRLETAHPGGSAVANYTVTYADGRIVTQEFKSYYRPWPERWLVGVASLPSVPVAEAGETAAAPIDTVVSPL
ncbi:MAG: VanW family protein [Patescibacteria group bacterium]